MILFIFEGKSEETICQSIEALFNIGDSIECVYDGNIYDLYSTYSQYGSNADIDIVSLLKEKFSKLGRELSFKEKKRSDFAQIFLFFDFDFHDRKRTIAELCEQVSQMLSVFDNETEMGKLYISYPMLEALRYTKHLPDADFYTYTIKRDECKKFKELTTHFSFYKNHEFITYKPTYSKEKKCAVRLNWAMLIKQNVEKANWLCKKKRALPNHIEDIAQKELYDVQLKNYIEPKECVSVLSAFALFLYDYFGKIPTDD